VYKSAKGLMVIASLPLVRSCSPECRVHFATAGRGWVVLAYRHGGDCEI
jgi:hypothetical protein